MEALLNILESFYVPVMLQLKVLGAVVVQVAFAVIVLAIAVWILGILKSVLKDLDYLKAINQNVLEVEEIKKIIELKLSMS